MKEPDSSQAADGEPVVSVIVPTYNHEPYLGEALDGVLRQQTSFPIEILVGEDASSDGTRGVVESYQERFPGRIRAVFSEKNLGGHANYDRLLALARGRYVALLEGDDAWTAPDKLQRQVDFLEANPEFSLCFHNLEIRVEAPEGGQDREDSAGNDSGAARDVNHAPRTTNEKVPEVSGLERITRFNYIWTASCVFRNGLIEETPEWIHQLPLGDWPRFVRLAEHGKLRYFDEVMGIYRVHSGGVWSPRPTIWRLAMTVEVAEACHRHLRHAGFNDCIYKTSRTIASRSWRGKEWRRALRYWAKCAKVLLAHPIYAARVLREDRKRRWEKALPEVR